MIYAGSSDYNCSGFPSSSGNATLIDQQDAQNDAAAASARHKHEAVVAVVVVLLLLLVGGAGGYAFWTLRKRRQVRREKMVPTQFPSMREEPPREEQQPAPAPGRWRVGADTKQSADRRDVEAPPYREYVPAPLAPGLPVANASPTPPPSMRPQLPRIQTTSPSEKSTKEKPPARYLESATALPSSEPATALTSGGTSGSASRSSRFAAFPVTSVRKPPAAGNPGAARSASAQAVSSTPARGAPRVARNATVGASTLAVPRDPFVVSEEDQVIMGEDYRGAERARRQPQGLPPRYQSLKGRRPRRDAD